MQLEKDHEKLNSILEEYKMSMGGCFFQNSNDNNQGSELEIINNAVKNHLFDIYELLSIYDSLSDFYKRELFINVFSKLIKLQNEENLEK